MYNESDHMTPEQRRARQMMGSGPHLPDPDDDPVFRARMEAHKEEARRQALQAGLVAAAQAEATEAIERSAGHPVQMPWENDTQFLIRVNGERTRRPWDVPDPDGGDPFVDTTALPEEIYGLDPDTGVPLPQSICTPNQLEARRRRYEGYS
jgi:hypothetical protein